MSLVKCIDCNWIGKEDEIIYLSKDNNDEYCPICDRRDSIEDVDKESYIIITLKKIFSTYKVKLVYKFIDMIDWEQSVNNINNQIIFHYILRHVTNQEKCLLEQLINFNYTHE
jgi:hypothetical protein